MIRPILRHLAILVCAIAVTAADVTAQTTGGSSTSTGGSSTSTGGTSTGGSATLVLPSPTSSSGERASRQEPVPRNVARLRKFTPEYVVAGPSNSSDAAVAALTQAGAQLISFRDLGTLNRRVMVFDFGPRLDLQATRNILATAAPNQNADIHHLYRYAQASPRLYAQTLIGDTGGCRTSSSRRIGIIDGPINPQHTTLRGANIANVTALNANDSQPNTDHGTAVAALIVGEDGQNGLSGFASGAQLYAIGAFGNEHSGVAADVDRIGTSLNWLLANNVKLINMSFAGPQNTVLADLLKQAERQGAIMIAAAGNNGGNYASYPAASPSVIAVTAVDANKRRYRRANWGSHIEFAAPGVDLYVADGRGGGYASGTSYAAPIVTALAARIGSNSLSSLRRSLQQNAQDLGASGRDAEFGWGLVRSTGC